MPIESITAGNLRRTQAFDAELRSADEIDKIAAQFADAILFQPNAGKRKPKIDELINKLVGLSDKTILPQAEKIGRQNALDVIADSPAPINLNDPVERAGALLKGRLKARQRLDIIKASVTAQGGELDASLTKYWTEPSEGSDKDKLERLRKIHTDMEVKRKEYEKQSKAFHAGEIKKRPNQPSLDYMSSMTEESKKTIRQQARRAGTDAEVAVFSAKGYAKFIWVTPNGAAACPDCQKRQSVVLTVAEWEQRGRPGSGQTVCGASCFCMLIPAEVAQVSPSIITGKNTRDEGPLTGAGDLAFFNANRLTSTQPLKALLGKPAATPIVAALPAKATLGSKGNPKSIKINDVFGAAPPEYIDNLKANTAPLETKERKAINDFVGSHYSEIRAADQAGVNTARIKSLYAGLDKLPEYKGVAYRGLKLDATGVAELLGSDEIEIDAISSFTRNDTIGIGYGRRAVDKDQPTLLKILSKTGRSVEQIARNPGEQEILIRKGTKFKITKREYIQFESDANLGSKPGKPHLVIEAEEI